MSYDKVSVLHRTGQWCPGVRTRDQVFAYDMQILPDWQVPGRPTVDRCYVLADQGIQLTRPVNFTGAYEGSWYVDLVEVEVIDDRRIAVHDRWVDFIVTADSLRYELLDLDELADAVTAGTATVETATTVLRQAQQFVDTHLRDLTTPSPTGWPDFPPAAIEPLIALPPLSHPPTSG